MRGLFVTFEGIEGSGKSTQSRLLLRGLHDEGREAVLAREPGGTAIGERVRDVLLDPRHTGMAARAELLLYLAARAQLVAEVIVPALDSGKIVVCDRYGDASVAYQGGGRGLGTELVREMNRVATGGLSPDLTVLLDLPVDEGLARTRARNPGRPDRLEAEPLEFHERVRRAYLDIAEAEPARFLVLDSRGPSEELTRRILETVRARLPR
jgi:dTMP kinase